MTKHTAIISFLFFWLLFFQQDGEEWFFPIDFSWRDCQKLKRNFEKVQYDRNTDPALMPEKRSSPTVYACIKWDNRPGENAPEDPVNIGAMTKEERFYYTIAEFMKDTLQPTQQSTKGKGE